MIRCFLRYSIAVAAVGLFTLLPAAAQTPSEQVDAYVAVVKAEQAARAGRGGEAVTLFQEALDLYREVARRYPAWNPEIVEYRISYCINQIESLGGTVQTAEPSPESEPEESEPVTEAPADDVVPPETAEAAPARAPDVRYGYEAGLAALATERDRLQAKVEELEPFQALTGVVARLQQEINRVREVTAAEAVEMTSEIEDARTRGRELEQELQAVTNALANAMMRLEEARTELSEVASNRVELAERNRMLDLEIESLETFIAETETADPEEFAAVKKELAEARAALAERDSTIETYRQTEARMKGDLEELRRNNASLSRSLTSLQTVVEEQKKEMDAAVTLAEQATARAAEQTAAAAAEQARLAALNEEMDELKAGLAEREATIEDFLAMEKRLKADIETLTEEKAQLTGALEQLQDEVVAQAGLLDDAVGRVSELSGEIDAMEKELSKAVESAQTDDKAVASWRARFEQAELDNRKLASDLKEAKRGLEARTAEMKVELAKAQENAAYWKRHADALSETVAGLEEGTGRESELNDELNRLLQVQKDMEKELEAREQELLAAYRKVENRDAQVNMLHDELQAFRDRLETSDARIRELERQKKMQKPRPINAAPAISDGP